MTSSPTKAVINLSACQHNLFVAKQAAPNSKCIAIIKANAYGHGLVEVAKALDSADAFGVARIEEALELRKFGITTPILLLEGFSSKHELALIQKNNFEVVIHNEEQLDLIEQAQITPITITLKIDSGMHRLGFNLSEVAGVLQRLEKCTVVKKPFTLMTHLANADNMKDDKTLIQIDSFYKEIEFTPKYDKSIANSAAILGWPQSHAAWNRPGIMLYGVSPFVDSRASDHNLQPVMTLTSKLVSIKKLKRGDTIGYSGTYVCNRDMRIGIVAIGYGDGYPRHAKSGTPVLVNGNMSILLGRVSMDMICIDLSEQLEAKVNDVVTLWGEGLPVEDVAKYAGTIGYELLCGVTSRVDFIYKK